MNDKSHGKNGKQGNHATIDLMNPMNLIRPMTSSKLTIDSGQRTAAPSKTSTIYNYQFPIDRRLQNIRGPLRRSPLRRSRRLLSGTLLAGHRHRASAGIHLRKRTANTANNGIFLYWKS